MAKLPTTEKRSRKDAIVSSLLLGIKSFDRGLVTQWQRLLIGVPAMTAITVSLGYLTAPEPCRESLDCVQMHLVESTRPVFSWIAELDSVPGDGKLPVLIGIACMYLYVIVAVLYASQNLVASLCLRSNQDDAG